jgi:chromosome segregation ATPase
MERIDGVIEQEQVSAEGRELSSRIEEIRRDVEFFSRRLSRLAKLEALLEGKYYKKLEALHDEFDRAERYQCELKSLAKQLKKNKERRLILKRQISDLEKHKKIIRGTMKQVTGYEKSSSEQIEVIREEREILCQRVQDLRQILELAEQAELSERELDIACQRVCATKRLLEEHETGLRKRTIDLLFEFYIPPRNSRDKRLLW